MQKQPRLILMLVVIFLAGAFAWCAGAAIQHDRANQALIAALKKGDAAAAIATLDAGADANARDDGGLIASTRRRLGRWSDQVRSRSVPPYSPESTALMVLFEPVPAYPPENAALVEALLDRGADPNAQGPNGWTILWLAEVAGRWRCVRPLLDHRARVNVVIPGVLPGTALAFAALRARTDIVELLLANGADVNLCDGHGCTPLMCAAENAGRTNTSVVRRLLRAGARVGAKDDGGSTALIWAASSGDVDTVRALLQAGAAAQINAKARDGRTALMNAVESGHAGTVRALLEAGADLNTKDADGDSALSQAAEDEHNDVVRLLVRALLEAGAGAQINARARDGSTALMNAAGNGDVDIVRVLLEAGADVHAKDADGESALSLAADEGYSTVVRLLKKAGAK